MALKDPDGKLVVYSSTQTPHYLHRALAKALAMPAAHIRVIATPNGGGFGGKSDPFNHEIVVAKAALLLDRPVKICLNREEVFYCHRGRHPVLMRFRTGVTNDGRITGLDLQTLLDGGAYGSYGVASTFYTGALQTVTYDIPRYRFRGCRVFTNKPPCGPKRGHGTPQSRFGQEVQLDKIAERLAIDPADLRLGMIAPADTLTANYLRVGTIGLAECIQRVVDRSGWRDTVPQVAAGPRRRPGVLVVSVRRRPADQLERSAAFGSAAEAGSQRRRHRVLRRHRDRPGIGRRARGDGGGGARHRSVRCARRDGRHRSHAGRSRLVFEPRHADDGQRRDPGRRARARHPRRPPSSAQLQVPADRLVFADRRVFDSENPDRGVTFQEAVCIAEARVGTIGTTGSYTPPKSAAHFKGGGVGPSPTYSYTAAVVEVDVDPETGWITVPRVWIAHDIGCALNPTLVRGQVEGSVYMGLGEALMEEQAFRRLPARLSNALVHKFPSMLEYKSPTSLDMPEIFTDLIEHPDPQGPFGAKEVGQGPLLPIMPAVANAVYDAVGVRVDRDSGDAGEDPARAAGEGGRQAGAIGARGVSRHRLAGTLAGGAAVGRRRWPRVE